MFDIITADDVPATNEFHYSSDPEIIFARNKVRKQSFFLIYFLNFCCFTSGLCNGILPADS